jgi:hypothetical protein
MSNSFDSSKSVVKYLYTRYGKLHKKTLKEQIDTIREIKAKHNQEQIKIMRRILGGDIEIAKEEKDFFSQPLTLFLGFLTIIVTLTISLITVIMSILGKAVDSKIDKTTDNEDIEQIIKGVINDTYPIYDSTALYVSITFIILIGLWAGLLSIYKYKFTRRRYALNILEESIKNKHS